MASARNELGDKFGGDDHRNSRGGHCRNSGQGEKRLETPSPTHGGECNDGVLARDGPTLRKDLNASETENNRMEDDSSDFIKPRAMRSESCREAVGEKDARDRANSPMCQEQQAYHKDNVGGSAHGVRPIDGDAEMDGMKFEGGGETSTSC